ncbi:hypothetical protein HYH02_013181 [Chlamydomonas schloesseri]|uniref:Uncharacterized protein n=1 Tax=Chlamydomonas schloesseri TaxID=2026947 RepID=A0A835VXW8_9CHLO|nr:hypothetical protein HYH02_013181 [Chlamydomonas schloesseri]|eukprot:KAG2431965.1 hypothetical protein HYH02_013181 [Chlamydomonas schloesseri]
MGGFMPSRRPQLAALALAVLVAISTHHAVDAHRSLLQVPGTRIDCSALPKCVGVTCELSFASLTKTVKVDFSNCVTSAINWACCSSPGCVTSGCVRWPQTTDVTKSTAGTCDVFRTVVLSVGLTTSSVTLQAQAGSISGGTSRQCATTCAAANPAVCPSKALQLLTANKLAINDYVSRNGGSLVACTQGGFGNGGFGFFPLPLTFVGNGGFTDIRQIQPDATDLWGSGFTDAVLANGPWHGHWTGPSGWLGLRPAVVRSNCPVPLPTATQAQNCQAAALWGKKVKLTAEICNNGIDDDGDGLIDAGLNGDPDCWVCGNGVIDPCEDCDDGNITGGDGCSSQCLFEY